MTFDVVIGGAALMAIQNLRTQNLAAAPFWLQIAVIVAFGAVLVVSLGLLGYLIFDAWRERRRRAPKAKTPGPAGGGSGRRA